MMLELSALVVNQSPEPTQCEVRFLVERKAQGIPPDDDSSSAAERWEVVHTTTVKSGPLAPGASAVVMTEMGYELLAPGASHRFSVAIIDPATGGVLGCAAISRQVLPLLPAAGLGALASHAPSGAGLTANLHGAGTMVGQHEAHRVGEEWIETGTGTMALESSQGGVVLDYAYTFRGPSDTSLTATATADGQLIPFSGAPVPVAVTSATAQVTYLGTRQQVGTIIQREGGTATGVFAALLGGQSCRGVLTLSNGLQTLDLATGRGEHRFDVRFSEAVGGLTVSPPSPTR